MKSERKWFRPRSFRDKSGSEFLFKSETKVNSCFSQDWERSCLSRDRETSGLCRDEGEISSLIRDIGERKDLFVFIRNKNWNNISIMIRERVWSYTCIYMTDEGWRKFKKERLMLFWRKLQKQTLKEYWSESWIIYVCISRRKVEWYSGKSGKGFFREERRRSF